MVHLENLPQTFIMLLALSKLMAMALLLYCEYLFMVLPICRNESEEFTMIYPYMAFAGAVMLAMSYICLTMGFLNCVLSTFIGIDLLISLSNCIGMFYVCGQTLTRCERPQKYPHYVPEDLGRLVWVISLSISLFLFGKLQLERRQANNKFF